MTLRCKDVRSGRPRRWTVEEPHGCNCREHKGNRALLGGLSLAETLRLRSPNVRARHTRCGRASSLANAFTARHRRAGFGRLSCGLFGPLKARDIVVAGNCPGCFDFAAIPAIGDQDT
jgi:hypothetical protein